MSLRHALYAGMSLLVLLCSACSINPYRRPEPIERPAPAAASVNTASPSSQVDVASSSNVVPSTAEVSTNGHPALERVAATAQGMTGVPYRYGGHSPHGFDCSGLVFYAYQKAGIPLPRTSREQLHASRPLALEQALPGDLVFFNTREKMSHVGIYLGERRFVHAPSTGKTVVIERLDQDYYQRHLIQIGRLNVLY